jgi:hypothetical protein
MCLLLSRWIKAQGLTSNWEEQQQWVGPLIPAAGIILGSSSGNGGCDRSSSSSIFILARVLDGIAEHSKLVVRCRSMAGAEQLLADLQREVAAVAEQHR